MTRPWRGDGGEGERAALEPLIDNEVPGAIPDEQLDPIAPAVQEAEHVAVRRVLLNHTPRRGGQAIKSAPKVHGLGRDKDAHCGGERQHDVTSASTVNTRRRSSVAHPGNTRTRRLDPRSISIGAACRPVVSPP